MRQISSSSTRSVGLFDNGEAADSNCRKSLSSLNFKWQFFSSSSPFAFFLYSRAVRVISQISQSHQRTLTLTMEKLTWSFSCTFSFFSRILLTFCYFSPLIGILRSFGVFILAKSCGLFNKFIHIFYGVLSLVSFFLKWIFYTDVALLMCIDRDTLAMLGNISATTIFQ